MVAITGFENEKEGTVDYYTVTASKSGSTVTYTASASQSKDMDEDVAILGISSDDYDNCGAMTMDKIKNVSLNTVTTESGTVTTVTPNAWIVVEKGAITAIFYDVNGVLVDEEGGETITATVVANP